MNSFLAWLVLTCALGVLMAWLGARWADAWARGIAPEIAQKGGEDVAFILRYHNLGGDIQKLTRVPRREWSSLFRSEGHEELAKRAAETI